MAEYQIITDSTTDLSPEMINELGIHVIPMCYIMGGKTLHNIPGGGEMDEHTFYEKLRGGETSTTAQINTEEFLQQFTPVLEEGKDILYLALDILTWSEHTAVSLHMCMLKLREHTAVSLHMCMLIWSEHTAVSLHMCM